MIDQKICEFCKETYECHGTHIREKHAITCEDVIHNTFKYIGGKLDTETDERVICHLSECTQCESEIQRLHLKALRESN